MENIKNIISDPKGLMSLVFICPECGGTHFGTSFDENFEIEKGHCHSYREDGTSCRFTWKRPEEDEKVFHDKLKFSDLQKSERIYGSATSRYVGTRKGEEFKIQK